MSGLRSLGLTAAATLVLVGCGTASADGPDRIEVAAIWTGGEQETFQMVIDAFTEETGIEVTYSPTGDDPGAILGTRAQGGDPPDVAIVPQPGLMLDLATKDYLHPLGDDVSGTVEENYRDEWLELGTVDGELYGVFFKAANKSMFWYPTDLWEDAGVEPPEDWDGLLDAAATFERYGLPMFAIAGADGWVLTDWFENIYLQVAGPERYRELARHEISWEHDTVIEALERFAEVLGEEAWLAGGRSGVLLTDFPTSAAQPFVEDREAATVFEADFTGGVIGDSTDYEPGEDADFFPFPRIEQEETTVVGAGDMAILMADSDGGREFIRFLASPEAGEIWAGEGGFVSPNQGVAEDAYGDDISARAAGLIQDSELAFDLSDQQPGAFGATVGRGLYRILQDFLEDPSRVEETAAELEAEAAEAWSDIEEGRS